MRGIAGKLRQDEIKKLTEYSPPPPVSTARLIYLHDLHNTSHFDNRDDRHRAEFEAAN